MERGDIITLAAGIVLVIVIAVAVKYGGLLPSGMPAVPVTTFPVIAATALPATTTVSPSPTPADPVLYRIYYTSTPLDHPVFRLPEDLNLFGASDIAWRDPDIVPFAYLEESRSGLTQEFSIPYGVWGMNITVFASTKPQYARFKMALCYADDGKAIEGLELSGPGSAFRSVQVSNTGVYLIIHMENVDAYRITFITPRSYFNRV